MEKQVEIPAPYIKDPSEKKYTLVLDLDETLIHFKVVTKMNNLIGFTRRK